MKDFIFLLLGSFVLAGAYFVAFVPESWAASATTVFLQNVFIGFGASLVLVWAINAIASASERKREKNAKKFFGDLVTSSNEALVYPDFLLSDEVKQRIADIPDSQVYQKRSRHFAGSRFIDVPHIVASNDLKAMTIVATELGRFGQFFQGAMNDGRLIANHQRSFVSFGLTSNFATQIYLNTDGDPLFKVLNPQSDPIIAVTGGTERSIDVFTDEEEREIEVDDQGSLKAIYGSKSLPQNGAAPPEKTARFGRNKSIQHGIVMRFRPEPSTNPSRYWFICAGLAAAGTPAAAYLLASQWETFHKTFGENDFLVVFKTKNSIHSIMDAEIVHTKVRKAN